MEDRCLLSLNLASSTFFGGPGDQRGAALAISGGSIYAVGSNGTNGLLVRYSVPPGLPLASHNQQANTHYRGVTASAVGAFTVGLAFPPSCGASDGVGGTEWKTMRARYTPAGTHVACASANFQSYTGAEGLYATTTAVEGPNTFYYAVGDAQANGSNSTGVLVKYETNGNEVWRRSVGDENSFRYSGGNSVAFLNGNVYSAGGTHYPYTDPSARRATLWKYNSAGTQQWVRQSNVLSQYFGGITAFGGALYAVGNVYTANVPNSENYLIEKYDEAGNRLWSVNSGGAATDILTGVVGIGSRLFAVGHTRSSGAGGSDAVILEVNPATGATLSTTLFGGAQNDQANGVATDGTDLYVVGESRSFAVGGNPVGANDVMLLRYRLDCIDISNCMKTRAGGGSPSLTPAVLAALPPAASLPPRVQPAEPGPAPPLREAAAFPVATPEADIVAALVAGRRSEGTTAAVGDEASAWLGDSLAEALAADLLAPWR